MEVVIQHHSEWTWTVKKQHHNTEASNTATDGGWHYAVVLGRNVAKSFAPRDIVWCKEIASWIGNIIVYLIYDCIPHVTKVNAQCVC